ncbi:MAG: ATP-binding protein [Bacteroidota bacterium]|nr:ATP-binding protein [Bacteroidota bacterium]MDE2833013.1 ATP-binding protein [Bacteroidota bacterium]
MKRFKRGVHEVAGRSAPRFIERVHDRGAARYFHGRRKELSVFETLCHAATESDGGTVLITQGPPGAGKTALLHECARLARLWGWQVADIQPDALWNGRSLRNSLRPPSRWWHRFELDSLSANVAGIGGGGGWRSLEMAPIDRLKRYIRKARKPVLLILDEAQILHQVQVMGAQKTAAMTMLKAIHNGDLGHPVVLLAAGLGHTLAEFSRLGISRGGVDDLADLTSLDCKAARAVIRDWLKKGGGAKGDVTDWMDVIDRETEGWPQHISAYGQRAALQIQKDGGMLIEDGLLTVLTKGRKDKSRYYARRLGRNHILRRERELLGLLIACCGWSKAWSPIQLASALAVLEGELNAPPTDTVEMIFGRGVMAGNDNGDFRIPIPSMERFLVGYARELLRQNEVLTQELVAGMLAALKRTNYPLSAERELAVSSDRLHETLGEMAEVSPLPGSHESAFLPDTLPQPP